MIIKENTDYIIKTMAFGENSRSTEVAVSNRNWNWWIIFLSDVGSPPRAKILSAKPKPLSIFSQYLSSFLESSISALSLLSLCPLSALSLPSLSEMIPFHPVFGGSFLREEAPLPPPSTTTLPCFIFLLALSINCNYLSHLFLYLFITHLLHVARCKQHTDFQIHCLGSFLAFGWSQQFHGWKYCLWAVAYTFITLPWPFLNPRLMNPAMHVSPKQSFLLRLSKCWCPQCSVPPHLLLVWFFPPK